MAGIPVGKPLQIVLVFWLSFPKVARWFHLGHNLTGPQHKFIDIFDRIERDLALLVGDEINPRPVTCAPIVPLTIPRWWDRGSGKRIPKAHDS